MPATKFYKSNMNKIIVKFVSKGGKPGQSHLWRRQLPSVAPVFGNCHFIFNPDAREYDWLAVYDDLPPGPDENKHATQRIENLACPKEHTILITAEPSTIKVYGKDFLAQFGTILTSQESWVVNHPRTIFSQPALRWFYGILHNSRRDVALDYDALKTLAPAKKNSVISTVTSGKKMSHTLHRHRYNFIKQLKISLPEMEILGYGVKPILDKAEGLDNFKYHVAIENHICRHHWTEKLADAFLGYTLPFYYGCPNAADYFPEESFIPININQFDETLGIIRNAIANNEYEKRLPYIIKARQLVLEKYNMFAVLDREIQRLNNPSARSCPGEVILSRHALHHNLRHGIPYLLEKAAVRFKQIVIMNE